MGGIYFTPPNAIGCGLTRVANGGLSSVVPLGGTKLVLGPLDYVTKLVSSLFARKLPLDGDPVAIHTTIPAPSLLAQAGDVSDAAFP